MRCCSSDAARALAPSIGGSTRRTIQSKEKKYTAHRMEYHKYPGTSHPSLQRSNFSARSPS
jgi:hypothetical protein